MLDDSYYRRSKSKNMTIGSARQAYQDAELRCSLEAVAQAYVGTG